MVQKGLLGEIQKITVGINGSPQGGPFKKSKPPAELDWNMWLEPEADRSRPIQQRCPWRFPLVV